MVNSKIVEEVITKVAKDLNLPKEVVNVAYRSYFHMVRKVFREFPFDEINSEEDLNNHKISINMPFLGKFYTDFNRIKHVRIRREVINKYNEEKASKYKDDKANVHKNCDNS